MQTSTVYATLVEEGDAGAAATGWATSASEQQPLPPPAATPIGDAPTAAVAATVVAALPPGAVLAEAALYTPPPIAEPSSSQQYDAVTETVTLRRRTAKEKLGFSFEQTATGVVVTKVFPNLPAGQSGRIDVDDELLSVNGAPCATLPETLRLLQAAGAGDVAVEVRHPPHDPTGNKVEVVRRSTPTAKLGVTLGTTVGGHRAVTEHRDGTVGVDKVFAGFPAAHLVVADRVLAINGNPVHDVKGAMKLLAAAGTEVALTLRAPRHAAVIAVFKPTADSRLGIDLSFDPSTGACSVSNLHAGFAAAASCLMVGDELIGVNGERVLNYDQTIYALRSAAAGEVRLRIIRRGGVTQAVAHAVIAEAVVV